jgi:multiple sugar transport system substrate-binding protein
MLVLVLALGTAGALFATPGAESTGSTAAKPAHLVIWGGVPVESGPQAVVDLFNKEFASKNISAEYTRFVNDDQGNIKLETTLLAGSDIDAYMTYTYANLVKRSAGNMALDLTPYVKKSGFDLMKSLGPEGAALSLVDGKPFALTTKTYNNGFLVNKDMFDAAGIPIPTSWTWDQFDAVARKLTKGSGDAKVFGVFYQTNSYKTLPIEFATTQLGGNGMFADDRKSTNLNNPLYAKLLTMMVTQMKDGIAPSHADSVSQKLQGSPIFTSGKAAMLYGSWLVRDVKNLQTYPHTFVTAYVPFPTDAQGRTYYMTGGPGDQFSINPKSANRDAAWEFVKWYTEGGIMPMVPYGRYPLYQSIDIAKVSSSLLEGVQQYFDPVSVGKAYVTPAKNYAVSTFGVPEINTIMNEEFEAAMLMAKTPTQALADAKTRSDAILASR